MGQLDPVEATELARWVRDRLGWDVGYLDEGFEIVVKGVGTFLVDGPIQIGYGAGRFIVNIREYRAQPCPSARSL